MAREPRAPRPKLDLPGQRPLLQGHLRRGGQRPTDAKPQAPQADSGKSESAADGAVDAALELSAEASSGPTAKPASQAASDPTDPARGKATRSPAEVATRRHLEGSEQGPA